MIFLIGAAVLTAFLCVHLIKMMRMYLIVMDRKISFDRFFDTLALVLILLPYQLLVAGKVTVPTILLFAFLVVVLLAYRVFPPSYEFLNRYIITSRQSKRSMMALSALEAVNDWYEYVRELVKGRYGILLLFSLAAWVLEIAVLAGFTKMLGHGFSVSDFGVYIESIVSGTDYETKYLYTLSCAAVTAVLTLIFTVRYFTVRNRKKDI